MDLVGSVDPYVKLKVGTDERRSQIVKRNYSPEWNEDFEFCIHDDSQDLELTLFDWDRLTKDEVIGTARVKVLHEEVCTEASSPACPTHNT